MAATVDILNPSTPKQILLVASNPSTSAQTDWPIGFWWPELTHPYWELVEHGYEVTLASPHGGALADDVAGQRIQPFWIEDEARKLPKTNFVVNSMFKPFALRGGNLITGQQQYSGAAAARS